MFKTHGISSYTKTGRGFAIGKIIGTSLSRGGGSRSYSYKFKHHILVTDTKIEILDGINKDENSKWMKDTLIKLVPDEHPDNIYTGAPEIWVDETRLNMPYFDQDIKDAINSALPMYLCGNITIRDGKIIIRRNYDFMIFMIVFGLFVMCFKYL